MESQRAQAPTMPPAHRQRANHAATITTQSFSFMAFPRVVTSDMAQRNWATNASAPLSMPVFAADREPNAAAMFMALGYCLLT